MGSPTKDATPHRTNNRTPGREPDSPLPPIHERLAYLRPSRELLEFYRQKIAQFDGEHEELLQMLEKYKGITEDQHKLQWEVRQREEEIAELQNALSDMQVYLFQEREQELEDRKKIQHLLALVGPDAGEITYFHREPPHKVTVTQRNPESRSEENLSLRPTKLRPSVNKKVESTRRTKSTDGVNGESLEQYKNDNQTLLLQVEALQAQMEEQTRLAKEQVESLLEDRRINTEEAQAKRQRDQERITALTDKLQQTQNLLYESTRDFLQLKFETRGHEKSWMVEKDRLLRDLDSCHNRLRKARSAGPELGRAWQPSSSMAQLLPQPQPESQQTLKEELKAMQEELKQAHRLAEMYREQCITLETELAQIREEGDVGREIFKERSDKMAKRLQLMTQRYEALEKRRVMEVEGFKTDLKHLRQKFKDVEKQLLKLPPQGHNSFGLLFDIDGVLVRGRTPIPAAKQCFRNLVDRNGKYKVPVVFVTNAGNCMRQTKAEHLSHLLEVEGPVEEVAHNLGFQDVVTIDMLREAYPLLDVVDHNRRPKGSIPPTKGLRPIDAVILFGEPIRWETNLQLIVDVLLTNGNPDNNWSSMQYPHIPVLACNMDLLWMAEAKNPRFGHGMFLVCLESLYKKVTGYELKYEALIGKPSVVTYNYAELLIRQQAERLGWTTPVKRLYAIGDNPMADIYGANLYNRYLQSSRSTKSQKQAKSGGGGADPLADAVDDKMTSAELGGASSVYGAEEELPEGCSSILVCTGVYSRDQQELPSDTTQTVTEQRIFHGHRDFRFDPSLTQPSFIVQDVKEAVELVFQQEGWPLE
ncbi:hypothetical protein INR49_030136 [Caranx melampygus]|nr:hypothetical protein INR49_030136 [Caranx melampygus]